jgi:meso-butanediol dehydrogenase/(S,S)-butanediol dehydrogenase/diacetyl reductase
MAETGLRRFEGKRVLLTASGGTGTGGVLARRFIAEGAHVVASDKNAAGLDGLKAVATTDGQTLELTVADVAEEAGAEALVDFAVEKLGGIDILCNHAAGGPDGRVGELSPAGWNEQIQGTLTSVFLVSHFAMPHLVESKGCVVNTASISGMGGDWGMAGYTAAKGAVINLTRSMAVEYGRDGVRVNSVSPGAILYPGTEPIFLPVEEDYLPRVALGRFATPEDIAACITFLCSADAEYITGQNIAVDGGITADNGQLNFVPHWRELGIR